MKKQYKNGTVRHYNEEGKLHREDGPAMIDCHGVEAWYLYGKMHREDGPAVTYPDGWKSWWINGQRHRLDGPAVTTPYGGKQYWINGQEYSQEEHHIIAFLLGKSI